MSNIDIKYTKIFGGGLAWRTRDEGLRSFFQQFGEIAYVNVVYDSKTGKSKGYGFVTFKDAESATRACMNPKPTIDERVVNCNLASANQFKSKTGFRQDDLCHLSPTFMRHCHQQRANLNQPLATYVHPYYWNQQYYPHWQYYAPYAPWYAPQCVVNINTTYLPHQPVNKPIENGEASKASVASSSSSTSRSTTDPKSDGKQTGLGVTKSVD
ncbi:unnamed protein product [Microthlaspi erraticum]|uniref:RRM domain-containing protein n=1 Tax=Microthlaspi erraticum TaxID=1685480 RepID=A0A6D2J5Y6_9BRAS|nr:unnamed protein product [Microthlaspi erraticum]